MKSTTRIMAVLLVAAIAVVALALLVLPRSASPTNNRGARLARTYCQSCHLFPEPALLDRASWANGVLPDMARLLGRAPPQLERLPNGEIVPDSDVFPKEPLISSEDWNAIVAYYAEAAPARLPTQAPRPKIESETRQFRVKDLAYRRKIPMTSMVQIDERARRLYVGDALTHTFESLDTNGHRVFAVQFDSGPISVYSNDGTLNVTTVGRLFPSDLLKGRIVTLNPQADDLKMDRLLGNLRRPVHATFADLNGDGREDCVVSQFGNRRGRLSWFERKVDGSFEEHVLSDRPGAIRVEVHDVTRDGRPDLIALMGQAWEGVYLFENLGQNNFKETILIQQHPLFGYSYFEMIDWNRDGHLDLLTTNGDNAESASPLKFYHGIRLYLNDGSNHFSPRWFFPLHGAYKARALDFDLDGDSDIAVISYFPDYQNCPEESFVYLENLGNFEFRASSFPDATSGRWMTMDAGDLDGDGDADIALGSLVLGPPGIFVPASIQSTWTNGASAVLLLENVQK